MLSIKNVLATKKITLQSYATKVMLQSYATSYATKKISKAFKNVYTF